MNSVAPTRAVAPVLRPLGGSERVWDATAGLTVYAVLLFVVPARLVVGPLGAVGTPAGLFALVLLGWYVVWRLVGPPERLADSAAATQPVRVASLIFAAAVLASYAAGMLRDIPAKEVQAADRGLIGLAMWLTLVLVASDGIRDFRALDRLLRVLVVLGSVVAAIGVLQFFTGQDVTEWIHIPGLVTNLDHSTVLQRDEFNRPSSTANHPIEFGVVMAMLLPIAVQQAFASHRQGFRAWLPVVMIGTALPMSISRSAILGATVAGIVLFPSWDRRRRLRGLVVVLIAGAALRVLVPGLVGTIRNLFTHIFEDTSTTARTGDYGAIAPFVEQAWAFGRGIGTFLPRDYRFLDNQYLLSLVETGFVGLVALVALILTGMFAAGAARRRLVDAYQREIGQGMVAALAVALVTFVTFDALSFSTVTGLFFLLLGCSGAYYRLSRVAGTEQPQETARADRVQRIEAQ